MARPIKIATQPNIAKYMPLTGWRRWLNRYLFIPFPRKYVAIHTADGYVVCHPDNVKLVQEALTANGYVWMMAAPQLERVK